MRVSLIKLIILIIIFNISIALFTIKDQKLFTLLYISRNLSLAPYLMSFRSSFNLVDIWHKCHPRAREMSWFNSTLSIGSCLDKFFISKNLVTAVEKCKILPCFLSDHDYVNLLLHFDSLSPRGPGLCKFNILFSMMNFVVRISGIVLLILPHAGLPLISLKHSGISLRSLLRVIL